MHICPKVVSEWNYAGAGSPRGVMEPQPLAHATKPFDLAKWYTPGMTKRKGPTPKRRGLVRVPTITMGYLAPRSPSLVHEEWFWSVLQCVANASGKAAIRPVGVKTGPLLSRARNKIVQQFLDSGDDYLLFVDTDIIFTWADLEYLLSLHLPIVSSVYMALDPAGNPVVAHLDEQADAPGTYRDVPISRLTEDNGDIREPFRVGGVGMGFCLIARDVIEALSPTKRLWPFAETDEEKCYGEDLTFCIRAREKGFETYLAPKSKVGHIKEIVI